MSLGSGIEWTEATWNPVRGCSRVSQGCVNCYAERIAARFSKRGQAFHGFAGGAHPSWTGRIELQPHMLDLPLCWKRPRLIFVNSMSDLFHERLPDEAIDRIFAVMALTPQHTYQVLTKRAGRMRDYLASSQDEDGRMVRQRVGLEALGITLDLFERHGPFSPRSQVGRETWLVGEGELKDWPLPNVWLGVSAEDQPTADERIPFLLQTPAAVRFLSVEPLLGPVDLERSIPCGYYCDELHGHIDHGPNGQLASIAWVIVGGESGPGARPTKPAWVRSIRDQCAGSRVPFFFKQWGGRDKKRAGRMLDGRTWDEMPERLSLGADNP